MNKMDASTPSAGGLPRLPPPAGEAGPQLPPIDAVPTSDTPPEVKRTTFLGRLSGLARSVGGVIGGVGSALGSLTAAPGETAPPDENKDDNGAPPAKSRFDLGAAAMRLGVLRRVTDQLRGAADTYIAAKLDEIEARVDAKLDTIEDRIDRKVEALHERLSQARDAELRHRLRLLKVTLIFTVLVALISLGYKLVTKLMAG